MKKPIFSLLLCAALLLALCLPASAAQVTASEAIETLETLGLVRGTGNGFEPEKTATRAEAAVMLLRLLGQESAAERAGGSGPFWDGGWADRYLSYAYRQGLVRGISAYTFGSDHAVSARDYVTMTLRALGYTEGTDFTWSDSLSFSDRIGLTHGEYTADGEFLREDLALVSYTALTLKMNGSDRKLIEALYLNGAVGADALKRTRLAGAVNAGKSAYSPQEIYEKSVSSMFYVEMFATEEDLEAGKPDATGSGFLISPDGVALMCYHELDGQARARATLLNGQSFDVTGVLSYDPLSDAAVVRLSRTDTQGNAMRRFPYLDLGDSDAVCVGDVVYVASNSLGMIDSFSGGLVSNRSREIYDPAHPLIQISTPFTSGGSGSPLLNAYGEVIGIMFATFVQWDDMHLAVPINEIRNVDLGGQGVPVSEVLEIENEKKAHAVLTADRTEITLKEGETAEVVISSDYPGQPVVRYSIGDPDVVRCEWENYVTMQSVGLKLTGFSAGKTTVKITFASGYGNEDASVTLNVRVTK